MKEKRKTLSVIISTYYSEGSLPELFVELKKMEVELDKRNMDLELVLIDDGSGDRSYEKLKKFKESHSATTLIKLTRNFGAVHASSTGFHYVTGDCFIVLAADLQDPPTQVLKMVDEWLKGHKFVISRRKDRKDPLTTRFFASIYYWLLHRFVVKNYPEGGFDLMLSDKELLPYFQQIPGNINYQLYGYWLGFTPCVLEYVREKRKHGKSMWTFRKKVNLMVDNLTGFSVKLIRFVAATGIIVSLLSFLYGAYMFTTALFGGTEVPGFATLVVLISFSTSIILSSVAILAEYIWRIFQIVNHKPVRVIEELHPRL